MSGDIAAILWKEWKEILSMGGGGRGRLGMLVFIGIFGIFMPLQLGAAWVESPSVLFYWAWVPLFLVASVVADAFAGERERHTLETLLASRLSDRAILFGKALASVGYAVGITWVSMVLGLVTTNLVHGQGRLLMYSLPVGAGILAFSLLSAGLSAGAGVLISLRASSVRQAQQTLSFTIMVLLFVPVFGVQALPQAWKERIFASLAGINVSQAVLVVELIFIGLNILFFALAMGRFKRAKLILD